MNNTHASRTRYLVELALMVTIIFVMAFTPLGYFRTLGLSITFLTVPVAVGAMILGPLGGAICGLAFGITSFMQCFGMGAFGTMLFSINPLGTAVVCIVPRLLEGSGGESCLPAFEHSVFYEYACADFLSYRLYPGICDISGSE